jgi:hypothetical protein
MDDEIKGYKCSCDEAPVEPNVRRISNSLEAVESEVSTSSSDIDLCAVVRKSEDKYKPQSTDQINRELKAAFTAEEQVELLEGEISRLKKHNEQLMKLVNNVMEYKELLYFRSKIGPVVEVKYNFGTAPDGIHWSKMLDRIENSRVLQHEQHSMELDRIVNYVMKLQEEVNSLKNDKDVAIYKNIENTNKKRKLT